MKDLTTIFRDTDKDNRVYEDEVQEEDIYFDDELEWDDIYSDMD